jgi:hypothetical protein
VASSSRPVLVQGVEEVVVERGLELEQGEKVEGAGGRGLGEEEEDEERSRQARATEACHC